MSKHGVPHTKPAAQIAASRKAAETKASNAARTKAAALISTPGLIADEASSTTALTHRDHDDQHVHGARAPPGNPGLLPDRLVAERYDCTVRTLERWDEKPELGFPPPIYVRRRKFRELDKLVAWERANTRKVAESSPHRAVAQELPRAGRGRFSKTRNVEIR